MDKFYQLVGWVEWVDKRRLRDSVIIILILILLGLPQLILQNSLGSCLSSTWDVISFQDPELVVVNYVQLLLLV